MPLKLVTRQGCHLCDEAREGLDQLRHEIDLYYEVVDVDADSELFRLYDFRVPVLLDGDRPLLEGKITEAALRSALGAGQPR